jgi:Ran GTPase-activating protein (RanGAP) involved in mRNA processing and transport
MEVNIRRQRKIAQVIKNLSGNKKSLRIDIRELGTNSDCEEIYTTLAANTTAVELRISDRIGSQVIINTEVVSKLIRAFQIKDNLQRLDFTNVNFDNETLCMLADALKSNTLGIRGLGLSSIARAGNNIEEGSVALAKAIAENTVLRSLSINEWDFSIEAIISLAKALGKNTTLKELSFRLKDEGIIAFAEALPVNRTLQEFNLLSSSSSDRVITNLIQSITQHLNIEQFGSFVHLYSRIGVLQTWLSSLLNNHTIKELSLIPDDEINEAGAQMIKTFLLSHSTLQSLRINCPSINNKTVEIIAEALQTSSTLTALSLQNVYIDSEGGEALARALMVNTALQVLSLRYGALTLSALQPLLQALKSNTTLHTLDFCKMPLGDEEICKIADLIKVSTSLRSLNLEYTHISTVGIEALTEALQYNHPLCALNIRSNLMSPTVVIQHAIDKFTVAANALPWAYYVSGFTCSYKDYVISRQAQTLELFKRIVRYQKEKQGHFSLKELEFAQRCLKYIPRLLEDHFRRGEVSEEDQVLIEDFLKQDFHDPLLAFKVMGVYQDWRKEANMFTFLPEVNTTQRILEYLTNEPRPLPLLEVSANAMAIGAAGVCGGVEEASVIDEALAIDVAAWQSLPFGEEM